MADMLSKSALRKIRGLRDQFENFLLDDPTGEREREARRFLSRRPCWETAQVVTTKRESKKTQLLTKTGEILLPAFGLRPVRELLRSREYVQIGSSFLELRNSAVPAEDLPERLVALYVTERDATEDEIRAALPDEHMFKVYDLCACVEYLTRFQTGPCATGLLGMEDTRNVFFTPTKTAEISWYHSARRWTTWSWPPSHSPVKEGSHIYCPI